MALIQLDDGGTITADSEALPAANAFDENETTRWSSSGAAYPHWIKYDFVNTQNGKQIVQQAKVLNYIDANVDPKAFTVAGSNNDSDWTTLHTGEFAQSSGAWQTFTFSNQTVYRYIRIQVTTSWVAGTYFSPYEIQLW